MNEYVLGVDLGTSAVKVSAMNRDGEIVAQQSFDYPLIQSRPGYSEQNPEDWVSGTTVAIVRLILDDHIKPEEISGISFSGQMHGLVLLDANNQVLRPAILWNLPILLRINHLKALLYLRCCGLRKMNQTSGHKLRPSYCQRITFGIG